MIHAITAPILAPLAAAMFCAAAHGAGLRVQRRISLTASAALCVVAPYLLLLAGRDELHVYRLGDWPPPFGVALVLDRLAAMLVALTSAISLSALIYAAGGADERGRHFHSLFQLEIAGLNGAFLAGDIFNLFVFFEVLLLASYGLLLHGGGAERSRAGLAYMTLNLVGSALFLIALGLLYGALGTLNLAHIALTLPQTPLASQPLARTTGALLVAVFALKAALLPLSFWLPRAYPAASAPAAALFSILTKVGVYALLRLTALCFSASPATSDLLQPWLAPLALATIAAGAIGAFGASRLKVVVANLLVVSTGALLAAVAAGDPTASAAALYYLVHSTLVTAAFFLLADLIAEGRGLYGDNFKEGRALRHAGGLGAAYLFLSLAISGTPPLSGFLGKVMLLEAMRDSSISAAFWIALLLSGLLAILVLARAGSTFFWEPGRVETGPPNPPASRWRLLALSLLLSESLLLVIMATNVSDYARAAAAQLHGRQAYVEAVLGDRTPIRRELRP